MTYVVIEFPGELSDAQGVPTGTNRGWVPASDGATLETVLAYAREIGRTDELGEATRLVEEGCCLVTQSRFDALVGLAVAGVDPGRVLPRAWAHLEACATCRAGYEARLAGVLQDQTEETQRR
jgi:hypothetical protein